jgi:hypothetical protein
MHAKKGKKKKMTRDQCNAKTNTHTHTHYPRTRNLLHSTAAHIISMRPGEANEEEAQEEGKYLRTKLTTSRRESLLKHCRKSHRERQSQREREREREICDTTFYKYRDFRENKKFLHND